MRTSRVSFGWSRDNRFLYLLFVKSPAHEAASVIALRHRQPLGPGWTVADLQRFWQAKAVWGAINSDGGGPAQLAYRVRNGSYTLIPAQWAAPNQRLTVSANFENVPPGGSLMYFYVRAVRQRASGKHQQP